MSHYNVGDTARISASFKDVAGAAADPTTVELRIKGPDGVTTTYTYAGGGVVKDSVGEYHHDLAFAEAGFYVYQWLSTGVPSLMEEASMYVEASRI
jgi:hypothetical protein